MLLLFVTHLDFNLVIVKSKNYYVYRYVRIWMKLMQYWKEKLQWYYKYIIEKLLDGKIQIGYDNNRKRLRRKNRKGKEVKTKHSCTENKLRCCGIVISHKQEEAI